MKTLYLCGVGNGEGIRLALTVNRAQSRWQRIVLLDDDPAKHGTTRLGLEVVGPFGALAGLDAEHAEVVNLVTRTTEGRAKARHKVAQYGVPFTALVHPDVDLFGTELSGDVTVYQHASIGAEASVGASSVVLVGAVVGHGARVGEGCVVAPNAVINARVVLGKGVYVGANASILPDLTIGDGATIGANSLVYADVPAGATALGVPAQTMPAAASAQRPDGAAPQDTAGAAAARDSLGDELEIEPLIVRTLQAVLGVAHIDRSSNFFDLGGTSLKALDVCRRLRDELGCEVQIVDVFRCPTAHALARHLGGGHTGVQAMQQAQQRAEMRRQVRVRR